MDTMADMWYKTVSSTGEVYFVNPVTKKTRWSPPDSTLPDGWEARIDDTGATYFIEHATETSTYVDPRMEPTDVNPTALNRGFGLSSLTAAEAGREMSLDGRTALITGANSGIGERRRRCTMLTRVQRTTF